MFQVEFDSPLKGNFVKSNRILFKSNGKAYIPLEIQDEITDFQDSYIKATYEIIHYSKNLNSDGKVFVYCAARILKSFKMTRKGPFKGVDITKNGNVVGGEILIDIWGEIGRDLMKIHNSVFDSGFSRDRYLLELDQNSINGLTAEIWKIFQRLLPFTMGKTTFGLVGASKILFSVLPEIILPIDTEQWLKLFQTVDLGDVIKRMVSEIQHWESLTGEKLNEMDSSERLTTLPSVYNVMAMAARP